MHLDMQTSTFLLKKCLDKIDIHLKVKRGTFFVPQNCHF